MTYSTDAPLSLPCTLYIMPVLFDESIGRLYKLKPHLTLFRIIAFLMTMCIRCNGLMCHTMQLIIQLQFKEWRLNSGEQW